MMRMLRSIWKFLNHPLLSASGNLLLLVTGVPVALAAALAVIGWLVVEPFLFVLALLLVVLDTAVLVAIWRRQRAPERPVESVPAAEREVFVAIEAEIALTHEEALEMTKLLRAEWPHITVDGALVQTALPDWQAKTTDFIGATLGSAQRAAFKASATGSNDLERLESEGRFLGQLGLNLTESSIRVSEDEFLAARSIRRTHEAAGFLHYENHRAPGAPPVDLRHRIDELMRRGMDVVDELSESVEPEEIEPGVWQVSGGDAPDEWREKADELFREARILLKEHQPALLKDFEEGYNRKVRPTNSSEQVDHSSDKRSTSEKMLALANAERSTPRLVVEATLDGLTEARRRLGG